MVTFSANHAKYGGAVYVSDETNSNACRNAQECPIQTLNLDQIKQEISEHGIFEHFCYNGRIQSLWWYAR